MREDQTCGQAAGYQKKGKRSRVRYSPPLRQLGCAERYAGKFHLSVFEMNLSYLASPLTHQPRFSETHNICAQSKFRNQSVLDLCGHPAGHTE